MDVATPDNLSEAEIMSDTAVPLTKETSPIIPEMEPTPSPVDQLFIAGIGASAGGLEALERLFKGMPADTGIAFVIIQHLSPDFKSVMDELLARHTRLPIHRVENGMPVRANAIYLLPPKKEMI